MSSPISSSAFTGSSQFSTSLQQSMQRAVAIASLPMEEMQNDLNAMQSQSSELSALRSAFNNVQSALDGVDSALGLASYSSSVSDDSVASVALSGTPVASSFSLKVVSMGAYATSMSKDSLARVPDPSTSNFGDATKYTLQVGTQSQTITAAGSTLADLADAINQNGAAQATIVNIGPPSAPDYRLYLQGKQLGDLPITLATANGSNIGTSLVSPQTTGADATYQVNGQPSTPIATDTRTVTVQPGVTVTLLSEGDATVNIARNTAALSSAFSNLASAYNSAMTEINRNHGSSGGALTGQSIVMTLSSALRDMVGYSGGPSEAPNLTALGLSLDRNGVLSFDGSKLKAAATANLSAVSALIGSSDTGGFLKSANDRLNSLTDSSRGVLPGAINTVLSGITRKTAQITDEQDKLNLLQTNLQQQMSAADAAIAALEQQQNYLQSLFGAMQTQTQANANA